MFCDSTGLPRLISSSGGFALNTPHCLKVEVRWALPTKISLKLQDCAAGCLLGSLPLGFFTGEARISDSSARKSLGWMASWPCSCRLTLRQISPLDLRVRHSSRAGPNISWASSLGTMGGSGIFLHLEGWSAGLASDLIQTMCIDFLPTSVQPRDCLSNLFKLHAEERRPFGPGPLSQLTEHLRGCTLSLTRSLSSLWIILASWMFLCCLWAKLHVSVWFHGKLSKGSSSSLGPVAFRWAAAGPWPSRDGHARLCARRSGTTSELCWV